MKATNPKIFGLILAGGYSRRMGQDKAFLEFYGRPQIENVRKLLRKYCARVFLSKRKDQACYKGLDPVDDAPEFSGKGPLGGILSAMKEFPGYDWLVVACDLPFITDETILALLDGRNKHRIATAFFSSRDALPEPLCALWEGHAYGPALNMFNEGIHCPRKVLIKNNAHLIKQNDPHWLDNINTPEEYERVRERALILKKIKK